MVLVAAAEVEAGPVPVLAEVFAAGVDEEGRSLAGAEEGHILADEEVADREAALTPVAEEGDHVH